MTEVGQFRLLDELREKNVRLAQSADKGSRKSAIRLYCMECVGGSKAEVRRCHITKCPLWHFRVGKFLKDGVIAKDAPDDETEDEDDLDEEGEAPL